MHTRSRIPILAMLIGMVAGCEGSTAIPHHNAGAGPPASNHAKESALSPAQDTQPHNKQDSQAAVQVLRRYYAAINQGDYARAYALWGNNGKASGKSLADFRKGFLPTDNSHVSFSAPGQLEGAAGSIYITIPVTVAETLSGGEKHHLAGRYVLRKTNNIPGAPARERHWHIYSARLHATDPQ